MKNIAVIDIYKVYKYCKVEINIILQGKLELSRQFFIFLVVRAVFDKFIKRLFVDFIL